MHLVWFRRDLRIEDNPALYHAAKDKQHVLAIYIACKKTWQRHNMSAAQENWIGANLEILDHELNALGIPLVIYNADYFSDCDDILIKTIQKYNIEHVFFNKEYEWDEQRRDYQIVKALNLLNISVSQYDDQCLLPPHIIKNQQEKPYSVFTPYKKAAIAHLKLAPNYLATYPAPCKLSNPIKLTKNSSFIPTPCEQDISWLTPGAAAGKFILNQFIEEKIADYHVSRDFPFISGTSTLSAYLAIGVISARQCVEALINSTPYGQFDDILLNKGYNTWFSELLWRDFYKMICFTFPKISRNQPFKSVTNQITWSNNQEHFTAWCQGMTGVPLVDSAMRQLNQTGWMHNRLRMVVAMYLSKNLWQDWRAGEAYFASKLVDWDFSANNGGWQWSASTGNDAVPYFRVFNPIRQSEAYDKDGLFIKKFCPELKNLDSKSIHYPYERYHHPINYPKPLVDLSKSRKSAIDSFKAVAQHFKNSFSEL